MKMSHSDTDAPMKHADDQIDIVSQSPVLRWLDNFWYHYKWTVIIIAFFVVVFLICVIQMGSDPAYDINITYSGPYGFGSSDAELMYRDLSAALPADLNGDGERQAGFIRYQIYSEEEIRAEWKQVEEEREMAQSRGEDPSKIVSSINTSYNSTQYQQFTNSLLTGQSYILLCSPFIYEDVKADGRVCRLADLTNETLANAFDDCAVLLKDTAMYRSSEVLQKLPEDTLICLLTEIPQLFSKGNDTAHADAAQTFLGMIR